MPASYQHLRVRLRIEQTRLLNWAEKIGLVEEKLKEPSQILHLNRNLIIDICLEIQALFRDYVAIHDEFDQLVPHKPAGGIPMISAREGFNRRFPRGTNTMLNKTLAFLERAPEVPSRLRWVLVKEDKFEGLVKKLIGYNDTIEALLDSSAINQLQALQQQTCMAMLQLNNNVTELKEISLAMQVTTQDMNQEKGAVRTAVQMNDVDRVDTEKTDFSRLADFKVQQMNPEDHPSIVNLAPVPTADIRQETSGKVRSEASYQGKEVWIEWKQFLADQSPNSEWIQTIENRVKKLAFLLRSTNKPPQFNAPLCLGYFKDPSEHRYGFLYAKPPRVPSKVAPTSLLVLMKSTVTRPPSLTKRTALAHAIARCLMFLHSVNWLHKGLRSNNVIFFTPPDKASDYSYPLIAGFEYARPDFPDEETEPPPEHSEYDIYRHPAVLAQTMSRSQKSHDIYSLGIVLVEIAYWKPIDEVMEMPKEIRAARSRVKKVRKLLLDGDYLDMIASQVGEVYAQAVKKCLTGGKEFGVMDHADESDSEVGARMLEIFAKDIVSAIGSVKV